jgi:hypothetical protein
MKKSVAAVLLVLATSSGVMPASKPPGNRVIADLLAIARALDAECRGGPHQADDEICTARNKSFDVLNQFGYCYGKKGEYGYQHTWHRCTKESLR